MGVANRDFKIWMYDSDWTADDLSSAADAAFVFDVVEPITIVQVGALVTTVMNGAATVAFDRRILTDSDTGRVNALNTAGDGAITIPTTTAVGKVVYKDVRVDCDPGDQIIAEVTTGATSGAAKYYVKYISRDEVAANLTDMVASA